MAKETDKRWKGLLQHWPTVADMDTADYELKPLNQQQTAILLAAISVYRWQTRWIDLAISKDELELLISDIELRLMQNQGGGFLMTPEEFYDANKRSIYDAWNDIAKQVVSGRTFGFTVGEDGTVTTPDSDDPSGELPEDDPLTLIDEAKAAKMGGAISVSEAIELYIAKIDTYYGPVNGTPVNSAATAEAGLKLYFPVDEIALEAALTVYYAYRATNNRILFSTTEAMQNYLYCRGISEKGWNRWLVDESGYASEKLDVVSQLTSALADEFWTEYYSLGLPLLSTQYLDAPCVPIEYQELLALVFNVQRNSTAQKRNHRILCTAEGYAIDTDGDVQDAFWYRTVAGVLTFAPMDFKHGASNIGPSQTEVPYRADHKYTWTSNTVAVDNTGISVNILRNAGMNLTGLSYPIAFKVTLKDLGEFTV